MSRLNQELFPRSKTPEGIIPDEADRDSYDKIHVNCKYAILGFAYFCKQENLPCSLRQISQASGPTERVCARILKSDGALLRDVYNSCREDVETDAEAEDDSDVDQCHGPRSCPRDSQEERVKFRIFRGQIMTQSACEDRPKADKSSWTEWMNEGDDDLGRIEPHETIELWRAPDLPDCDIPVGV